MEVFPARAGMIRAHSWGCSGVFCIPRESGDDPAGRAISAKNMEYSPRERG